MPHSYFFPSMTAPSLGDVASANVVSANDIRSIGKFALPAAMQYIFYSCDATMPQTQQQFIV